MEENKSDGACSPSVSSAGLEVAAVAMHRQEAFIAGLRAAQQIAWNLHKHHGRERATAYDAHEAIRSFANGARDELANMKDSPSN